MRSGPVTSPPPAALLSVIGYVSAASVGLSALGVVSSVIEAFVSGEIVFLAPAVGFGVALWLTALLNRRVIAWWVRRQPSAPRRSY